MSPSPLSRLGLGAVRFGQERAVDARARPPAFEAAAILDVAARAGVTLLDTAPGVEDLLGGILKDAPPFRLIVKADPDAVEACARLSLRRLGAEKAETLVVSAADLMGDGGPNLWRRMKKLQEAGLFAGLGVSASPEEDAVGLARRFKPEVMQLPLSLLDQRALTTGALGEIAGLGVDIQLHSALAQGRLFAPAGGAPRRSETDARVSRARRMIAEAGADPLQATLAFALSRMEASAVLVGVSSGAQLRAVIAAAMAPAPAVDWSALAIEPASKAAA